MGALNGIEDVDAKMDSNHGKLSRDVTVTLTGKADRDIPRKILKLFGSAKQKFVFSVKGLTHQNDALKKVKALKGVATARIKPVDNSLSTCQNMPATLNVTGDVDPKNVLDILRNFGTAMLL